MLARTGWRRYSQNSTLRHCAKTIPRLMRTASPAIHEARKGREGGVTTDGEGMVDKVARSLNSKDVQRFIISAPLPLRRSADAMDTMCTDGKSRPFAWRIV